MGVQGLWALLEPVGRRIQIEAISNKTVAVDASIWLTQFIKAMRDEKGELVRNAHLLGFFRRICRLLFHKVRPVFVFDGATPALKRRTTFWRRKRRDQQSAKLRKTAEKLLLNQLQARTLSQVQEAKRVKQKAEQKTTHSSSESVPHPTSSTVTHKPHEADAKEFQRDVSVVSPESKQETRPPVVELCPESIQVKSDEEAEMGTEDLELQRAIQLSLMQGNEGGPSGTSPVILEVKEPQEGHEVGVHGSHNEEAEEDEEEDDEDWDLGQSMDVEALLPEDMSTLDPEVLAQLPASVQLEMMQKVREARVAENRQGFQEAASNPLVFSQMQMQTYLKGAAFKRKMNDVIKNINSKASGAVESRPVTGEQNTEYFFVKNKDQSKGGFQKFGGGAKDFSNPGGVTSDGMSDLRKEKYKKKKPFFLEPTTSSVIPAAKMMEVRPHPVLPPPALGEVKAATRLSSEFQPPPAAQPLEVTFQVEAQGIDQDEDEEDDMWEDAGGVEDEVGGGGGGCERAEVEEDLWEDAGGDGGRGSSRRTSVEGDGGGADGQEKPVGWRAKMAARHKMWSLSHGFKLGRKLDDWEEGGEDEDGDPSLVNGQGELHSAFGTLEDGKKDLEPDSEEAELQRAIQLSLMDTSNVPSSLSAASTATVHFPKVDMTSDSVQITASSKHEAGCSGVTKDKKGNAVSSPPPPRLSEPEMVESDIPAEEQEAEEEAKGGGGVEGDLSEVLVELTSDQGSMQLSLGEFVQCADNIESDWPAWLPLPEDLDEDPITVHCCGSEWILECPVAPSMDRIAAEMSVAASEILNSMKPRVEIAPDTKNAQNRASISAPVQVEQKPIIDGPNLPGSSQTTHESKFKSPNDSEVKLEADTRADIVGSATVSIIEEKEVLTRSRTPVADTQDHSISTLKSEKSSGGNSDNSIQIDLSQETDEKSAIPSSDRFCGDHQDDITLPTPKIESQPNVPTIEPEEPSEGIVPRGGKPQSSVKVDESSHPIDLTEDITHEEVEPKSEEKVIRVPESKPVHAESTAETTAREEVEFLYTVDDKDFEFEDTAPSVNLVQRNAQGNAADDRPDTPKAQTEDVPEPNLRDSFSVKPRQATEEEEAWLAQQDEEERVEAEARSLAEVQERQAQLEEERKALEAERRRQVRNSATVSGEMYTECQELLQMFGIPFIIAPQEAEAQCAFLNQEKLVDGVVTDDSDVLLFGGTQVYKNIFENQKYVESYSMTDITRDLGLGRDHLINMALLLGSDYTEGVDGVGVVNAMEIVQAFPGLSGLKEFKEWVNKPDGEELLGRYADPRDKKGTKAGKGPPNHNSDDAKPEVVGMEEDEVDVDTKKRAEWKDSFVRKHRTVRKNWEVPEVFPCKEVVQAYSTPQVDQCKEKFEWGCPDRQLLRHFCATKFDWDQEKVDQILDPVIEMFQQRQTQLRLDQFFPTHKIAVFKSVRLQNAVAKFTGKRNADLALGGVDSVGDCDTSKAKATSKKGGRKNKKSVVESPSTLPEDVMDTSLPKQTNTKVDRKATFNSLKNKSRKRKVSNDYVSEEDSEGLEDSVIGHEVDIKPREGLKRTTRKNISYTEDVGGDTSDIQ